MPLTTISVQLLGAIIVVGTVCNDHQLPENGLSQLRHQTDLAPVPHRSVLQGRLTLPWSDWSAVCVAESVEVSHDVLDDSIVGQPQRPEGCSERQLLILLCGYWDRGLWSAVGSGGLGSSGGWSPGEKSIRVSAWHLVSVGRKRKGQEGEKPATQQSWDLRSGGERTGGPRGGGRKAGRKAGRKEKKSTEQPRRGAGRGEVEGEISVVYL